MTDSLNDDNVIIKQLYKNLFSEAEILDNISNSYKVELHEGNIEAENLLNQAVFHATYSFRDIGEELYSYGGFTMMQDAIYTISKAGFSIAVIESAWNGIGDWTV